MKDSTEVHTLIRAKLADGRLPLDSIPRIWGGPGNGEICDGCDQCITNEEFIMEGLSRAEGRKGVQFHAVCFYIWDNLRRL